MIGRRSMAVTLAGAAIALAGTTGVASAAPAADPVETYMNNKTGWCLDYNSRDNVHSQGCNGGAWQQWRVHTWADGTKRFQNVATGVCLTRDNMSYSVYGAQTCNSSTEQSWRVDHVSGGLVFRAQFGGFTDCLDDNYVDGVRSYPCNSGPYQVWY